MFWLAEVFNGSISQQEMKRLEHWAHRQRAEAVRDLLAGVGGGLNWLLAGVGRAAGAAGRGIASGGRGLRRWHNKRAAIRELSALSDHTLKDIGLVRGDIHMVVEALLEGAPDPRATLRCIDGGTPRSQRNEDDATGRDTGERDWQRAA